MSSSLSQDFTCPRCGGPLADGFINAGKGPMRWVTTWNENKTIFGGERLARRQIGGRIAIPAARCLQCRLGVFSYDPDDGAERGR